MSRLFLYMAFIAVTPADLGERIFVEFGGATAFDTSIAAQPVADQPEQIKVFAVGPIEPPDRTPNSPAIYSIELHAVAYSQASKTANPIRAPPHLLRF